MRKERESNDPWFLPKEGDGGHNEIIWFGFRDYANFLLVPTKRKQGASHKGRVNAMIRAMIREGITEGVEMMEKLKTTSYGFGSVYVKDLKN